MKFTVSERNLYNGVQAVKSAVQTKLAAKNMVLEVKDGNLFIYSNIGGMFAEIVLPVTDSEPGTVVMSMDSFDVFQYASGQCTFTLKDNALKTKGSFKGKLNIADTDTSLYTKPADYPTVFINVSKNIHRLTYTIDGRNNKLDAIFIKNGIFATSGSMQCFAGMANKYNMPDVTLSPLFLNMVDGKKDFLIGFTENLVFASQGDFLAAMPKLPNFDSSAVIRFAWYPVDNETCFMYNKEDLLKMVNVIHAVSKSKKYDKGDGRGCLQLSLDGTLKFIAKDSEIGGGELEVQVEQWFGSFIFGLSTMMLKQALDNVEGQVVTIYKVDAPIGDRIQQALIICGDETHHFIAEDPTARISENTTGVVGESEAGD